MKKSVVVGLLMVSQFAFADKFNFSGSDTLAGVMTDAIIASGLSDRIVYVGGGSGVGEKAIVNSEQALAPMSREIKPEALAQIQAKGQTVTGHVIALDGLAIFVNSQNSLARLSIATITDIFNCKTTRWEQVANSGRAGAIAVYRRNDQSGTTDAFKHFTGIKTFGECVKMVAETNDIAEKTSHDENAIGYAGMGALSEGKNRYVPIAKDDASPAVLPTTATVRDFSYPMARRLYVYEVNGAVNDAEQALLTNLLDRSFLDPIVQDHEFVTLD